MLAVMEAEALDILFIQDDPDIAEMYRLKLELDGYWVRVVRPEGAVAAAREHFPEIMFLDLSSGVTERLQILGDIRRALRRPDLPSIILAPFGQKDLMRQGAKLAASDYLVRLQAAAADLRSYQPSTSSAGIGRLM